MICQNLSHMCVISHTDEDQLGTSSEKSSQANLVELASRKPEIVDHKMFESEDFLRRWIFQLLIRQCGYRLKLPFGYISCAVELIEHFQLLARLMTVISNQLSDTEADLHGIQEHIAPSDLKAQKATPLALHVWSRMETGIKNID
jgi:hypothetical protein